MAQFYSAKRRVTTLQIITVESHGPYLPPFGQGVCISMVKTVYNRFAAQNEQKLR